MTHTMTIVSSTEAGEHMCREVEEELRYLTLAWDLQGSFCLNHWEPQEAPQANGEVPHA